MCLTPNALILIKILRQFTVFGRKAAVMFVVLRNVEPDGLIGLTDTHRNHLICNKIERVSDGKREHKHNGYGNDVVQNEMTVRNALCHKAFGLILIDKHARQDCAHNTAHAVCREDIERIVDACVVLPVAGEVRYDCGDNGNDTSHL